MGNALDRFLEAVRSPLIQRALLVCSVLGFVLTAWLLITSGVVTDGNGGSGGGDVIAYWTAGGHILNGQSIYIAPEGGYAAFTYPPIFAQVLSPFSVLPLIAYVWLWRAFEVACLRVAVGSWRNVGLAMLLWPPVVSELYSGNVHLIAAAAVALVISGDARAVVPAALTKFAAAAAIPTAFWVDRRGLAIGLSVSAVACAVSFAVASGLWFDYANFLGNLSDPGSGWFNIGSFVPTPVRLAVAALLSLAAIRWVRLAAVAVTLSFPVLWFHSLSALVALFAPGRPALATDSVGRVGTTDSLATQPR
jgi:hypothetical protein